MADIPAGRALAPPAHIPAGLAVVDTAVAAEPAVEEAAMAADMVADTTDRQLLERAHQIDPARCPH
ncbi:MAG: hypothetical protein WAL69_12720 [Candidatus Acidiferrales bacterium]